MRYGLTRERILGRTTASMDPERWQQVNKVLIEALGQEADQRKTFLEAACGGDEGLRREVEALLAADEEASSFLQAPPGELAAQALGQKPRQSLAGQKLGPYEILSLLGQGGMGEVYCAQDTRLGRQVAIKLLPQAFLGDPERLARFQREARLLASLNHPNVAAIHGLEEAAGKRFLILELVEGKTLAEQLKKKPLPIKEALEVCCQISEGLEAAHEKGIIHRDLKPANVKITPAGKVKILDFGLAKALNSPLTLGPSPPGRDL